MVFFYLLLSLLVLFLAQRRMAYEITRLVHRLGGGQKTLVWIWSVIFLPGTITHEVSHFLFAAFTGARTGKIEIFPEYLEEELEEEDEGRKKVALGYVETQRLNPLQGFLVGFAPFISGSFLLIYLASLMFSSYETGQFGLLLLEGYFFFTLANSFFPSWSDIQATLPFFVLLIVTLLVAWYFGLQPMLSDNSRISDLLNALTSALLISIGLNFLIVFSLMFLNRLFRRRR